MTLLPPDTQCESNPAGSFMPTLSFRDLWRVMPAEASAGQPLQFRLWELLAAITVASVLLAVFRAMGIAFWGGMLWAGCLVASCVAILLVVPATFGIAIFGIGALGLTPIFTARAFYRRAQQAWTIAEFNLDEYGSLYGYGLLGFLVGFPIPAFAADVEWAKCGPIAAAAIKGINPRIFDNRRE